MARQRLSPNAQGGMFKSCATLALKCPTSFSLSSNSDPNHQTCLGFSLCNLCVLCALYVRACHYSSSVLQLRLIASSISRGDAIGRLCLGATSPSQSVGRCIRFP